MASFKIKSSVCAIILLTNALATIAQIPLPGDTDGSSTAPEPGFTGYDVSRAPLANSNKPKSLNVSPEHMMKSEYGQLPLNTNEARSRIDELRQLAGGNPPSDVEESVQRLCEWLNQMVAAHNKMANAFIRNESTKIQSQNEKQLAQRFAQLRNEAELVKVDILIKQRRYQEALTPLVNIVIAEPLSPTGQKAYKLLKDIGFSNENVKLSQIH